MFNDRRWIAVLLLATGSAACVPPAVVPSRPTERLPLVEIEVRNTATQSDDYVSTTAAPARIRVLNHPAVSAAVPVTLKNVDHQAGPELRFGAGAAANLATLSLTLPADGTWVPFVVAGLAGQNSQRDKDALIEVLEARADGIVLGRKSLMVTGTSPVAAGTPRVEVQVNGAAVVDDYVAWRPVNARVRLSDPPPGAPDVGITLRNMAPQAGGRLVFGATPALDTVTVLPSMGSTVALTLPGSGEWVSFQVAGSFENPSRNDKDAVLEVVRTPDGALMGREGLMVRVRKNADSLTSDERDRFVNAVARANADLGSYVTHQEIHATAGGQAHSTRNPTVPGPAFLPWHRAFVLRLERELQAVDPAVALHYWRFDEAAPTVFHPDFMGNTTGGATLASFSSANPLATWSIQGFSGVQRRPAFAANASPSTVDATIISQTATIALGNVYSVFRGSEQTPHNPVHTRTGNGGWLASLGTAVRDPLFFMLHSNVDRLWALWQFTNGRYDPDDPSSYDAQGSYSSAGSFRMGHYADDRMWPWDGTTGYVNPGDPKTLRPSTAPGGPLPASIGGWGPAASPRPRDLVPYDRWRLLGLNGLGYGYDDVPFSNVP